MATVPISNPSVPFLGLIPGGLTVGRMIRVRGQLTGGGSSRFSINLQQGPAVRPCDDVALHLSVRPSENSIVRNHQVKQVWGQEERHGGCPIHPGQTFDILILAEHNFFKIAINNSHYCTFNYRIPVNQNTFYIRIDGQCTISYIGHENDTHPAPMPIPPSYRHPSAPSYVPITPYVPQGPTPPPPPPPYTPPFGSGVGGTYSSTTTNVHHYHHHQSTPPIYPSKKKKNKALKYAAGIGGAGLGLVALSRMMGGGDGGEGDDGGCDVDFGGE